MKCGFRKSEYIKKLSSLKHFLENHNIENWLDMEDIEKWRNSSYPDSIEKQPIISHSADSYDRVNLKINGMIMDLLDNPTLSDIKYSAIITYILFKK